MIPLFVHIYQLTFVYPQNLTTIFLLRLTNFSFHVFGSTCPTGQLLQDELLVSFPNSNFHFYSSNRTNSTLPNYFYFDFHDFSTYHTILNDASENLVLISLAPLKLFSNFLFHLRDFHQALFSHISCVISISSSSSTTKRYAFSPYDKFLSSQLNRLHLDISSLCKSFSIKSIIILPSMIYGSCGGLQDHNISKLRRILTLFPFILLPNSTGLRQPIHISQLSSSLVLLTKQLLSQLTVSQSTLLLGGDEILSYKDMLLRIKNSSPSTLFLSRGLIISVPNRFFFFIFSPLILLSPRWYEALLRMSSDLSGFSTASSITTTNPLSFFTLKPLRE